MMKRTLGGQSMPPSILGGGYGMIRQMPMPMQSQPVPIEASPFAMPAQGEQPAYGSDAWALQTGGPGAMILREMVRSMVGAENPLAFLDPKTKAFSPEYRALLGPQFQKKSGK